MAAIDKLAKPLPHDLIRHLAGQHDEDCGCDLPPDVEPYEEER